MLLQLQLLGPYVSGNAMHVAETQVQSAYTPATQTVSYRESNLPAAARTVQLTTHWGMGKLRR